MWPWEHAAAGYLLYSLGLRALGREPPTETDTAVLAVAVLVPDLVDKPLSWGLGWFPSGNAVAHSVFVAVPLGVGALALGRQFDRRRLGVAFAVGYWSHLLGDVLNPLRNGDGPLVEPVLWPLFDPAPYEVDYGIGRGLVYLREFGTAIVAMDPLEALLLYVLLPALAVTIWVLDGAPGSRIPLRLGRAARERLT
jgi:hypothetical protein